MWKLFSNVSFGVSLLNEFIANCCSEGSHGRELFATQPSSTKSHLALAPNAGVAGATPPKVNPTPSPPMHLTPRCEMKAFLVTEGKQNHILSIY